MNLFANRDRSIQRNTILVCPQEKDPFLGMSEEDMNKLDRVLFSEEGQKVFETSVRPVGSVVANKAHLLTTELHELTAIGHNDFIIDDVIIQVGHE